MVRSSPAQSSASKFCSVVHSPAKCWPETSPRALPASASSRPDPDRARAAARRLAATRPSSRRSRISRRTFASSRPTCPASARARSPTRSASRTAGMPSRTRSPISSRPRLGRVHVGGHAMGGGVALALARVTRRSCTSSSSSTRSSTRPTSTCSIAPGASRSSEACSGAADGPYALPDVRRGFGLLRVHGRARGPRGRLLRSFNAPAARQAAHATIVAKADTRRWWRACRASRPSRWWCGAATTHGPVEHGRRLARALKGRFEVSSAGAARPTSSPRPSRRSWPLPAIRRHQVPPAVVRSLPHVRDRQRPPEERSATLGVAIVGASCSSPSWGRCSRATTLTRATSSAASRPTSFRSARTPRSGSERIGSSATSSSGCGRRAPVALHRDHATLIATAIGGVSGSWPDGSRDGCSTPRSCASSTSASRSVPAARHGARAALDRTTPTTILLTLGLTGWLGTARIVRRRRCSCATSTSSRRRALGQSTPGIMLRHVLPNVAGRCSSSDRLGRADDPRRERSFVPRWRNRPATPTWGHMLFEGQDYFTQRRGSRFAPGLAIMASVLGFNMLGEGCAMRSIRASSERLRAGVRALAPRSRSHRSAALTSSPPPSERLHRGEPTAPRGMLTTASFGDIRTLDPQRRRRPRPQILQSMFAGLIDYDVEGKIVPTSPTAGRSRRTALVPLRPPRGVRFHDGEEVTADDVNGPSSARSTRRRRTPTRATSLPLAGSRASRRARPSISTA